jgi:hypothetical protein
VKISIALDCWTSPFQQAFMAVTGYFIDDSWAFREILLAFEPLAESHTGVYLGKVLANVLQRHGISQGILGVTTDNASNNITLMKYVQGIGSNQDPYLTRIPCIAHVIQLCLTGLLKDLKLQPNNEITEKTWTDSQTKSIGNLEQDGILGTLQKVTLSPLFLYSFSFC